MATNETVARREREGTKPTTIDLPQDLWERIKIAAIKPPRKTFRTLVIEALAEKYPAQPQQEQ